MGPEAPWTLEVVGPPAGRGRPGRPCSPSCLGSLGRGARGAALPSAVSCGSHVAHPSPPALMLLQRLTLSKVLPCVRSRVKREGLQALAGPWPEPVVVLSRSRVLSLTELDFSEESESHLNVRGLLAGKACVCAARGGVSRPRGPRWSARWTARWTALALALAGRWALPPLMVGLQPCCVSGAM